MADRIHCCVPFCRRSIAAEKIAPNDQWVCENHWKLVPMSLKAEYRLARRRVRKILRYRPVYAEYWNLPGGSPARVRAISMWRRVHHVWAKCKAAAIEAAGGLV